MPTLTPAPIGGPNSGDELLACLRLLATLAPAVQTPSLEAVCRDLVAHLRGVATFDTAVIYLADESLLSLESVYSAGSLAAQFDHVKIPMAEQLTGWVGAHRTPVWNSDAALDAPIASRGGATIASSMPLVNDASVVGVLTLYSVASKEVSVSQRRAIESLLPAIGEPSRRPRGIAPQESTAEMRRHAWRRCRCSIPCYRMADMLMATNLRKLYWRSPVLQSRMT